MLKYWSRFLAFVTVSLFAHPLAALAAEGAAEATSTGGSDMPKFGLAIAAGIGMGIAALGGALGQGKAAQATLEGIARNPEASGKLFTPMILCLAFIESLVLFTFVMCILLQGKLG